jgi:uncharacterized protein with NAD-binding domain and iron-sulfur cluster
MEATDSQRGRLIVLGGGIASLSAAFHASAPGWEKVFPGGIHVYEMTEMLGGKGASRRRDSKDVKNRIEEHGLHVWFGSYDNAFSLLADCHAYLEEQAKNHHYQRWSSSLRDVEDGFRACSRIGLMDHDGASWLPWVADFPEDSTTKPWEKRAADEQIATPSDLVMRALRLAEAFLYSLGGQSIAGVRPRSVILDIADVPIPIHLPPTTLLSDTFDRFLSSPGTATPGVEALSQLLRILARLSTELRNRMDEPVRRHSALRRGWQLVDLLLAAVRGLIDDGVVSMGDFSLIDDFDLRAWLMLHGASEESVSCSLLKVLAYDLPFAYEAGNPEKPLISAAVGVYGLFRLLLTYRGAVMWKLNAGMGEVVFAPIYEALVRRGVHFHFGHEVEQIHLDGGERPRATKVSFRRKPSLVGKVPLDVVSVSTGPLAGELPYWTSKLAAGAVPKDIELGRHDMVVYGLPVATILRLIPQAPPRWLDCARRVKTVSTACVQLWLNVPVQHYAPWASPDITVGAYTEPFDTWSDMHTLAGEGYAKGAGAVRSVAYFCNVAPEGYTEAQLEEEAKSFFAEGIAAMWPAYRSEMRVDDFLKLNHDDSSRYTLSLPGTLRVRLSPRDDSIRNMRPVGDWTRNCISAGCVESAVISGMLAATQLRPDYPLSIFGEKIR